MTESDKRIDALLHEPLHIERTRWQKLARLLSALSGVVACVALTVSIIDNSKTSGVAACTNNNLADRNGTSGKDTAAAIRFAHSLEQVLLAPKPDQTMEYTAVFLPALSNYVNTLQADQAYRDSHPLVRC